MDDRFLRRDAVRWLLVKVDIVPASSRSTWRPTACGAWCPALGAGGAAATCVTGWTVSLIAQLAVPAGTFASTWRL